MKVNWPELDRSVLEELCKDTEDPKALITVIATKGSVPRKAGAKMLVWPYGKTMGSIGGGLSKIIFGSTGPRGGQRDGLVQAAAKSAARSIGTSVAREIMRGVLGSILGGSRRR